MRQGAVVNSPDQIMAELMEFYFDLYHYKQQYSAETLQNVLNGIDLPCLSEAHRIFQ